MKKNILTIVAVLCLSTFTSLSQTENVFYRNAIGLTASMISGSGLAYRYSFNERFAWKVAGFIFYNETTSNQDHRNGMYTTYDDNFLIYNLGTEFQLTFYRSEDVRLFGLVGINYIYDLDEYRYPTPDVNFSDYDQIERTVGTGIGVGIEVSLTDQLMFNVDGGYMYRYYREELNYQSNFRQSGITESRGTRFGAGIGISYAF